MPFRVSTGSTFLVFQNNLGNANSRIAKLSEELATLKRVNRPSDDPNAANFILGAREGESRIAQYQKNVNFADRQWLQIESASGEMIELFNRAKELAIQGNNGTLGASERTALAEEINGLAQQLLSVANTKINGDYIFSGFFSQTAPYELDAAYPDANPSAVFNGDSNIKSVEISEGQTIDVQLRLDDLLVGTGAPGEVSAFQVLANLEAGLRNNNVDNDDPASVGQALDDVNAILSELTNRLSGIGAKSNRLQNVRERLEKQSVLNQSFMEQIEGVDPAEAAYNFQRAQLSLQAVIQSAGAVFQNPSLMSFLG